MRQVLQMNRAQLEKLKEQIERLDPHEHVQLFDVISKYTTNFTKVNNGVLVSSDTLSQKCLQELETLVTFYLDQRKRMDADSVQRQILSRKTG
jgi:hypothetical protein